MKVLVTGGTGFLGGRLVEHLSSVSPMWAVRVGSRRPELTHPGKPGVEVVAMRWDSPEQLEEVCAGVHAVVHLAGMNAADCSRDPAEAMQVNAVCTGRLLQAAIARGVERFVYLSTAHVYGSPLAGTITEEVCPKALHPYASSHRAGEDLVRAAHQEGRIAGVVLRLSNAYGAPGHPDANCWMLLMNDLCRQAVTTRRMVLASSGRQTRDFITLTDACRAIAHFLEVPPNRLGDGLFNVGGSHNVSVLAKAELIRDRVSLRLDADIVLQVQPHPSGLEHPAFDYGIGKLLGTGFELGSEHQRELDALVDFCVQHFGQVGTHRL